MINSSSAENILSELDNPNLFAEEREALQILAALLAVKGEPEAEQRDAQRQAA
jgi:hypothetical protein